MGELKRFEEQKLWLDAINFAKDLPRFSAVLGLFDARYYNSQVGLQVEQERDLLIHYLAIGWHLGFDPSPDFSTSDYLDLHKDVAQAKMNPLVHYALHGKDEQREIFPSHFDPHPSEVANDNFFTSNALDPVEPMSAISDESGSNVSEAVFVSEEADDATEVSSSEAALLADIESIEGLFDPEFYRQENPDLPSGTDDFLIRHFLIYGWKEDRDPSAEFSVSDYIEQYPDIRGNGINPLLHYALFGANEGRAPKKEDGGGHEVSIDTDPHLKDDMAAVAPFFDADFYRSNYEDILGSNEELLYHFMTTGWREHRDPNAEFSCQYYIENYQDIENSGVNPFLHYVLFGKYEGRRQRAATAVQLTHSPDASLVPDHLQAYMRYPDAQLSDIAPPKKLNASRLELHWIIPDFTRGSGGHMTIFRTIRHLELFGHKCKIWIETPTFHKTSQDAWEEIVKYFQCVEAEVDFIENGFFETTGDAVIATGWSTAFLADRAEGFAGKFYFVQDHELEFYPTGSERLLARQSYDLDLNCICASPWLDRLMTEKYGLWARHFYLAYDPELYKINNTDIHEARLRNAADTPTKIAVYARDHTARRCVQLALMALETLGKKRDDIEVHFFGQEHLNFSHAPFKAYNHGILDAPQLAELYNHCHIGICFSGTNYSLVPQEMMACGLPLLELDGESTRAIFPSNVVALGGPDPLDIAAKIEYLIDNPYARQRQAKAALKWVSSFSWYKAARDVESALKERLGELTTLAAPAVQSHVETMMDVVIPTYNGMGELEPVIEALRQQKEYERLQIFCIDSSSSDGTIDWIKKQKDISLTVINQKDFQHGRTRNDGIALGKSPLIGILTQDATPTNATWASDIEMMFNHVDDAAGLFGRHTGYPDHPLWVREELETHFENMLKYPLALSKDTDPAKWESGDIGWRQFLHFYSDNNSAMRRRVWNEIPYPEVDYGEDQVWARDIIEAGYTKLYSPTACVFHSHDYTPDQTFKRAQTEAEFFFNYFGYDLSTPDAEELEKTILNEQIQVRKKAKLHNLAAEEIQKRLDNVRAQKLGWEEGVKAGKLK